MLKPFALFGLLAVALVSCDDDPDPTPTTPTSQNVVKAGLITADETWTSGNIYELAGRVVVDSNVTLTIEPGTIIKGRQGVGSLASALIVARYGKLMAEGTAAKPIVFTSILDNITVGQSAGTNLDETNNGLWGGLIVLGNAPISADAATVQIEGIPADDKFGRYGGANSNDNSGSMKYISIRHGGSLIGEGNEINGLTLGGVGAGTTIEYIEIVANQDDGFEPFGGNVNITNALVWAQGDDAYDVDQAYSGTIDNFVYIAGPDSDHGMEIDGPEGSLGGSFTLKNGTLQGLASEYADFRDGAMGTVSNVYFFNFPADADVELDDDGSSTNYTNSALTFTNWEINSTLTIADIFKDKSSIGTAFDNGVSGASIVTTGTVGADLSKFGWTYASAKGALSNF